MEVLFPFLALETYVEGGCGLLPEEVETFEDLGCVGATVEWMIGWSTSSGRLPFSKGGG